MQDSIVHIPVLVKEVIHYINPQPHKVYVDVTFGSGGHSRAILQAEPDCIVIGMDWDLISLEKFGPPLKEEFPDRFSYVWGNFGNIKKVFKDAGVGKVDGILADFGTSFMHLFERPGFSFYRDSKLDMRMSPSHAKMTAAEVVNKASQETLANIFYTYGQEPHSRKIAQAIVEERKKKKIETTRQLALLIESIISRRKKGIHPATQVFQALRIYVNSELEHIQSFLINSIHVLNPQARIVCISFHSLEDGIVKHFFREKEKEDVLHILTKKVVRPTDEEVRQIPSSRSSRLRAAELI